MSRFPQGSQSKAAIESGPSLCRSGGSGKVGGWGGCGWVAGWLGGRVDLCSVFQGAQRVVGSIVPSASFRMTVDVVMSQKVVSRVEAGFIKPKNEALFHRPLKVQPTLNRL